MAFPRVACPRLSAEPALRCGVPVAAPRITFLPHVSEGRFCKVGIAASRHAGSRLSPGPARRWRSRRRAVGDTTCVRSRGAHPRGTTPPQTPGAPLIKAVGEARGGRFCFTG
uniref:Uncharacterized protein n=1 Tax=Rangifer tarandus platyrhynchus TaxID=3082113 RepID=A0ACB0FK89_RANTA|nr:unnamed protein product [Rangifer tarandus platyrhynchus]